MGVSSFTRAQKHPRVCNESNYSGVNSTSNRRQVGFQYILCRQYSRSPPARQACQVSSKPNYYDQVRAIIPANFLFIRAQFWIRTTTIYLRNNRPLNLFSAIKDRSRSRFLCGVRSSGLTPEDLQRMHPARPACGYFSHTGWFTNDLAQL